MGVLRGVFVGTLTVAAIETLVSSKPAANRAGTLGIDLGRLIERVLSPDVPAIGPRTGPPTSSPSSATAALMTTLPPAATRPDYRFDPRPRPPVPAPIVAPPPMPHGA